MIAVILVGAASLSVAAYLWLPTQNEPATDPSQIGATDTSDPATLVAWRSFKINVTVNTGPDGITFTSSLAAKDWNETTIEPSRVLDPPLVYYATSSSLIPRIQDVAGWRSCDPRTCNFIVPNGTIAYIDADVEGGLGTVALNVSERGTYRLRPGDIIPGTTDFAFHWSGPQEWPPSLEFRGALAKGVPIHSISIRINSSAEHDHDVSIKFYQNGQIVRAETVNVERASGFQFPPMVQADTPRADGAVTIVAETTASSLRPSVTIGETECASHFWSLVLDVGRDGKLSFGPARCQTF